MSYLYDDWWEYKDESTNKSYFYNTKTNATTWEKPTLSPPNKPSPPPPKIPEKEVEKVEEQTKPNIQISELKSPRTVKHERSISDYSEVLHQTSLDSPTDKKLDESPSVSPRKSLLEEDWVEIFDKVKQKPYYYNTKTKKTQWKRPESFRPYERGQSILVKNPSGSNLTNRSPTVFSPNTQNLQKETFKEIKEVEEEIVYEPFTLPNFKQVGEEIDNSLKGILVPLPSDIKGKVRDPQISNKNTLEVYAKSFFKPKSSSFFKNKDAKEESIFWQKTVPKGCYHSFQPEEEKILLSYYNEIVSFTMTPNSDLLVKILQFGLGNTNYRNELYIYVIKQINGNPSSQYSLRGLRLLTALVATFLPTKKELTDGVYLFINELKKSQDSSLSQVAISCEQRLLSQMITGFRKTLPNINVLKDILLGKSPLPIFGVALEQYIEWQNQKFPNYKSVFIMDILIKQLYSINAFQVEGIFRITGEASLIEGLMDQFSYGNFKIDSKDPHVISSLLKIWLRELAEPLIPSEFYDEALAVSDSKEKCVSLVAKFPKLNQSVLLQILQFLGMICNDDFYNTTKMSIENISVVFAPNILRNTKSSDPRMMMLNSSLEAKFVKNLILSVQSE